MAEQAVVDRIVDGTTAVLLVGEEQREVLVPRSELPASAKEGTWLSIDFESDRIVRAEPAPDAEERTRARIGAKMERLRRRGRRGS